MRVTIAIPGRFKSQDYQSLVVHYTKLTSRFAEIACVELPLAQKHNAPEDAALEKFLESRSSRSLLVVLHEKGRLFSSREFARQLEKWRDQGISELIFAVGGAREYGPTIQDKAALKLSLSPLTMAHELATAVLAEQVFRGFAILANHPYHNE